MDPDCVLALAVDRDKRRRSRCWLHGNRLVRSPFCSIDSQNFDLYYEATPLRKAVREEAVSSVIVTVWPYCSHTLKLPPRAHVLSFADSVFSGCVVQSYRFFYA